jgi:hypothetical protein
MYWNYGIFLCFDDVQVFQNIFLFEMLFLPWPVFPSQTWRLQFLGDDLLQTQGEQIMKSCYYSETM